MTLYLQKISKLISANKRLIIIVTISLCVTGIICLWEGFLKDTFFPKNFGVVEKGQIYRSGLIEPSLIKKVLLKYKIKKIISLSGDPKTSDRSNAERQVANELGIERVIFSLPGNGVGDVNDYAHIIAEICQAQKEKKTVLVHCVAGAQRTGGVIATYRLIVQHKDATSVRAEMTHYGFDSDSDTNLRAFLNSNMMKIAEELKKMGVIDRIPSSIPEIRR